MLTDRCQDKRYGNWLKVSLSLMYMSEGLADFAKKQSKGLPPEFRAILQPRKKKVCNRCRGKVVSCDHVDPIVFTTGPFDLAKLISSPSSAQCDTAAILTLMMKCRHVHQFVSNVAIVKEVKHIRNITMHTTDMLVEDIAMNADINRIVHLLQDQRHFIQLLPCQEAVRKITELRDNVTDVTRITELELKVLQIRASALQIDVGNLQDEFSTLSDDIDNIKTENETKRTISGTISGNAKQKFEKLEEMQMKMKLLSRAMETFIQFINTHGIVSAGHIKYTLEDSKTDMKQLMHTAERNESVLRQHYVQTNITAKYLQGNTIYELIAKHVSMKAETFQKQKSKDEQTKKRIEELENQHTLASIGYVIEDSSQRSEYPEGISVCLTKRKSLVKVNEMASGEDIHTESLSKVNKLNDTSLHLALLQNDLPRCQKLIESKAVNIHHVDFKGDTILHHIVKNYDNNGIVEILLNAGADSNAQNVWNQAPLHLAATTANVHELKILLRAPAIDVNIRDINGYEALHCFICSNEHYNSHWQDGLNALVCAGTDVNSQTKFGNNILHLAAPKEDNTTFIRCILENFRQMDVQQVNMMGETFLHVYVKSEIFEEIFVLLDDIHNGKFPSCSREDLKQLLNHRDVCGETVWFHMLENGNWPKNIIEKIISYGADINIVDNLGNTALHRFVSHGTSGQFEDDLLKTLIENVANVNALNMFGQSVVSFLYLESALNIFLKYNVDCNNADKWGHSPLVSIMHRCNPNMMKTFISEGKPTLNATDKYGSTALHQAAYQNKDEHVEILLQCGADPTVKDSLGDTPQDTARRHNRFQSEQLLSKADPKRIDIIYRRTKTLREILIDLPETIHYPNIEFYDVHQLLGLPNDIDEFTDALIRKRNTISTEQAFDNECLVSAIHAFVKSLCNHITDYDSKFEMIAFPTGSSVEATKVGDPDEFDFVLCLEKLNEACEVVIPQGCLKSGFACLKFKEVPVNEEYIPFSDQDGFFLAYPFLQYFERYVKRALNEKSLWENSNLVYCNLEDSMHVIKGKPVFNFDVFWSGALYKQIKISIDIVPAVYKQRWWPDDTPLPNATFLNKQDVKNVGCFLILQTRKYDFNYASLNVMDDLVSHTCDLPDSLQRRMLRISAAPAEILLMKTLPTEFRNSYILAKILKSKDVCPQIKVDELPTTLYTKLQQFKPFVVQSHCNIKSYMLKNCTFYVARKLRLTAPKFSTSQITAMIYEQLLKDAEEQQMRPFFLPYSDVFEFERDKTTSSYKKFVLKLERELSIKLVLGILTGNCLEVDRFKV